jgi:hypothetical protein
MGPDIRDRTHFVAKTLSPLKIEPWTAIYAGASQDLRLRRNRPACCESPGWQLIIAVEDYVKMTWNPLRVLRKAKGSPVHWVHLTSQRQ